MKLFEYAEQFAELFDSLDAIADYEPEMTEVGYIDDDGNLIPDIIVYKEDMQKAWFDTLDGIEEEFDIKAENVACFIKQLEGELDMIKKQKAVFEHRRKSKENQIKRLEDYLLECMNKIHRTKIEAVNAKITVRTNAETAQFVSEKDFIKWAKVNAPELLNYGEPTIYKTLVKNALKSGRELPGASLGRTQSLTIK